MARWHVAWHVCLLFLGCVACMGWVAAAAGGGGDAEEWLPCDDGAAEFIPLPELMRAPRYAVHLRMDGDDAPAAEEEGGSAGGVDDAALARGIEMAPRLASRQEVEMVQDGLRFRCSVPAYPPVLRSVHPRQELRLRGPGESLMHHPLDRGEMLLVDDLLAPMQGNCYFQTVRTVTHLIPFTHRTPQHPSTRALAPPLYLCLSFYLSLLVSLPLCALYLSFTHGLL